MPIYWYWEYERPLMMHEGALAPLRLLRASFLLIKRLNLTVYLVSSNICIPAWMGPTASDSVHRFDERQLLQNNWLIMGKQHHFTVKKYGTDNKRWSCQTNTNPYARTWRWGKRAHLFPAFTRCLSKATSVRRLLFPAFMISCDLLWPNSTDASHRWFTY